MNRANHVAGFSLLEMLMVLAIVAILATLALPNYRDQMQHGRRMDAISSLLSVQMAQEKWRASHPGYADLADLGWASALSLDGHYQLRLMERSAAGFVITARPVNGGPQDGDRCGVFALDQRGPILTEGYADAACWRR